MEWDRALICLDQQRTKNSFFPDVDFYVDCNRVLGFFPVNNFVHRMVNFVAKVNFKTCSISEIHQGSN